MSCILCDSYTHVSQSCEIFEDKEARQEALALKRCCKDCVCLKRTNHSVYKCRIYRKCYICYSKEHHTLFCPERFMAPKLFIPNIGGILLPRFFQTFDPIEKYLLAFSSPLAHRMIDVRPLKILNSMKIDNKNFETYPDSNVAAANDLIMQNFNECENNENLIIFFELVLTKRITLKLKSVTLKNVKLSSYQFYKLLSPSLKILNCNRVIFTFSGITFSQMLAKMPTISTIELHKCNIKIDDFWLESLTKYVVCHDFSMLSITIRNVDFDAVKFFNFISQKSTENVRIKLYINHPFFSSTDVFELIKIKLSKDFIQTKHPSKKMPLIFIYIFQKKIQCFSLFGTFTLRSGQSGVKAKNFLNNHFITAYNENIFFEEEIEFNN